VGGVGAALKIVQQIHLIPDPRFAVVHIQGQHRATGNGAVLTAAFSEKATNETTYVLNGILGALFQFAVFLNRLGGADGGADPLA